MKVFSVLIIVMTLVYVFLITWYRELGRPIFLEAIFGLTHILHKTLKKIGHFDKTIVLIALNIVMVQVCVSLVMSFQE